MINHDGKVCVGDVWEVKDCQYDDEHMTILAKLEVPDKYMVCDDPFNLDWCEDMGLEYIFAHYTLIHRNEQESCEDCEVGYWIRGGDQKNLPVYKKTVQTLIKEGMAIVLRNFCPECGKDLRGSDG